MDKDAEKNKIILDKVGDLMSNFLYYDRKEDELLPPSEIERCLAKGIISINEILTVVRRILIDDLATYLAETNTENTNK